MNEILDKANKKQNELFEKINESGEIQNQRPLFHFSTPGGWCNDPNGFSQFKNQVHLFFQYHPYSTQWGPMHWGHVVSDDMLDWQLKPVALAPDSEADCKGCFSGTALEYNGKHLLAYTGVSNNEQVDIQNQCLALGDGTVYEKNKNNPILTGKDITIDFNQENFRDPKIWKKNGKLYLACVIKKNDERGACVMFESSDAKSWIYKGILDSSKDGLSKMWECPDIFEIDGKDVFIFSPQEVKENFELGFHDGNNSVYATGFLDYEKCEFKRKLRSENGYTAALVDYGIDFYAPETTKLNDGRTIMIAWMQAWESYITPENFIWSGMMTLPRELHLINNRLYQLPIRELENWKNEKQSSEIQGGIKSKIMENQERHFELDLHFEKKVSGFLNLILGDENQQIIFQVDFDSQTISFNRLKSQTPGKIPFRKTKLRTDSSPRNLKIIFDTCSMEAFFDDGIMTFTNAFFFNKNTSDLIIENSSNKKIIYELWKIKKTASREKSTESCLELFD